MAGDVLRSALRAARVLVAIVLVVWLVSAAGFGSIDFAALRLGWMAAAVAMVPVSIGVRAFSLGLLLNRDGRLLGPGQLYRLTLIGAGLGLVLPTGAADLAKARYGLVVHGHAEEMVVSTVWDKLTSLTAVGAMGAVAATFAGDAALAGVALAIALVGASPFFVRWEAAWRFLVRLLAPGRAVDASRVMRHARPPGALLMRVYAVSVLGWLVTYAIVYAAAAGVSAGASPATVFALAPLATISKLVPISAGGLGLGEFTMVALFVRAGIRQTVAAQAALAQMLVVTILPGVAGLLMLAAGRRPRDPTTSAAADLRD